ncbi:hypothetical protein [Shewanella algae]|uniref:hypothetical protein n=1 Tax=Shewanella algae TaxID=38313 RepID=UPI00313CC51E
MDIDELDSFSEYALDPIDKNIGKKEIPNITVHVDTYGESLEPIFLIENHLRQVVMFFDGITAVQHYEARASIPKWDKLNGLLELHRPDITADVELMEQSYYDKLDRYSSDNSSHIAFEDWNYAVVEYNSYVICCGIDAVDILATVPISYFDELNLPLPVR